MVKRGKDGGLPLVRISNGADIPPTGAFIALVDGQLAPLLPLDLPEGLKGQARERVALRQMSDAIGLAPDSGVELRPFALKGAALWRRAIVSATDQVQGWRDQVQGAGARCAAILPDYLALPVADKLWTLHGGDERVIARLGQADGFSAPSPLAQILLEKAISAKTPESPAPPEAILCLGTVQESFQDWLLALDIPVFFDVDSLVAKGFSPPQAFARGELALDLARDPRAAFEALSKTLRAWRLPLVLALLGLGVWSASMMVQTEALTSKARTIRSRTVEDVRRHFVPTGPVLDIRAQVSQVLAARQAQNAQTKGELAPLDLLKSASAVIVEHPGRLLSSSFQPQGGVSVDLLLPDFASLDQLVSALDQAGLAVRILNAGTAEEGGVAAALALLPKEGAE